MNQKDRKIEAMKYERRKASVLLHAALEFSRHPSDGTECDLLEAALRYAMAEEKLRKLDKEEA